MRNTGLNEAQAGIKIAGKYINNLKYADDNTLMAGAPRPLVSIAGQKDPIFPIEGSKRAIETAKRIYEVAGAPGKAKLYISPGEHLWYEDIAWEGIIENLPW